MNKPIRILLLENSPTDAEMIEYELSKSGLEITLRRVEDKGGFERALSEFDPDLILSDYNLPRFSGISALATAVIDAPDTPFIFVSGAIGEDMAIDTLKGGATDYVLKSQLSRLPPSVQRALEESDGRRARRHAEAALKRSLERIQTILDQTVQALASVTEIRDPYTAGHQQRVSRLAKALAVEFGLPRDLVEGLRVAATLHDIGKIAVPAEILTKPSMLDDIEFGLVKEHSRVGYEILKGIDFPWPVAKIVLQHHERIDGSGYPRGLKGNQIMPESRILAVADVVEAMASHRPYRAAYGVEAALQEIRRGRGHVYDSEVSDACVRLFTERGYSL